MFEINSLKKSLESILKPWYDSLSNPILAQKEVLSSLLEEYSKTDYGRDRGVIPSLSIDEYRKNIPPNNYSSYKPIVDEVAKGHFNQLFTEKPIAWVMTRGTSGLPKIIPINRKHMSQILFCGARALVNHIISTNKFDILKGKVLNLNFPSRMGHIKGQNELIFFGHSSGTYAKYNPNFSGIELVPRQEKIDELGPSLTKKYWEARFDLTYNLTKDEDVKVCMGVTPVMISFAKYLQRKIGKIPKDFWKIECMFCTSVAKIHHKYAPILRYFYGNAPIIEMYTATEGVFAQQIDNLPYVVPNYDAYFFEVIMGKKVKMLYEMKRGEWGKLIISNHIFPRYDIGDMIECLGKNYFRVFGRARKRVTFEHVLYRCFTRWFI